jgi:uncharacterized protein YkwD
MKNTLLILILFFSMACNLTNSGGGGNSTSSSIDAVVTDAFMTLINDHRNSIGLKPLILSPDMSRIAQTHSANMASGAVAFGHDGFSARCAEAIKDLGGGNLCAENVAEGQKDAQAAFDAWMNSPGHRANIEQPVVTHTGFGYAQSSNGTFYWTQTFLQL